MPRLTPTSYLLQMQRHLCETCGSEYTHSQLFLIATDLAELDPKYPDQLETRRVPINSLKDMVHELPLGKTDLKPKIIPICEHCYERPRAQTNRRGNQITLTEI